MLVFSSAKINVFGLKFISNTLIYVDIFLLTFYDRGCILKEMQEVPNFQSRTYQNDAFVLTIKKIVLEKSRDF